MKITYSNYLKIDELLELQKLKSQPEEHDEMLFIIIHQTYELWFKQMLHEFEKIRTELEAGHTWTSVKTMRRVLTILKTMVAQIDILETMTPLEFESFRDFLDEASGFQSVQFREIEILCGLRSTHMLKAHEHQPEYLKRLKTRMKEATLWECFCGYLRQNGYDMPEPERKNNNGLLYESSKEAQQVLLDVMKNDPETALLAELFVDFDEGMQEWRYRHVKMVERTIGNKMGTGGSDGVGYLRKTLHQRIFPDLWEIRAEI
jgi:tryptophan 2,3-dioxygenase